jgi:hypothetical protein
VGRRQVVLVSATMPQDVLEVTKRFMRDPIRILVKRDELTLEGIKQFYIAVDREVRLGRDGVWRRPKAGARNAHACVCMCVCVCVCVCAPRGSSRSGSWTRCVTCMRR